VSYARQVTGPCTPLPACRCFTKVTKLDLPDQMAIDYQPLRLPASLFDLSLYLALVCSAEQIHGLTNLEQPQDQPGMVLQQQCG
jgi:hypothetical protein